MFSLLKNISTKNKLWALLIAAVVFSCFYSLIIIYMEGISNTHRMIAFTSIIIFTIISLILNRIIILKFIFKLNENSGEIIKHCKLGDDSLKSIKDTLSQFITLTGIQLDALNDSSKLMQNISEMLLETTKNSEVCKEISDKVTRDVNEGNEIMQKMVEAVIAIEKTKEGLIEISSLINQISNDTSTIHIIVSTTELLSLNASIEAAKAGQTGKGFSVVAEEVGNLAKHSGNEAKEIENIVIESQKQIQVIIEANQSRVEVGKVASNDALAVFSAIKAEMFGISSRSENIRAATWEQKIGIDQMNRGNSEIRNILKKNITDTVNLLKIYNVNVKNFRNIKEVGDVLREYWAGDKPNEQ
jgi:methyl-accepting chemotaxis protein